jgi:5-methylcytosine-specific restriction endonuclease McrA
MTPLYPTPDYYLHNLIAMTSPEAKRLWRRSIKEHFDCTCVYCGTTYDIHELTLDHVRPKAHGGADTTHNVVCCCRACNQEKGTTHWKQFIQQHSNPLREYLILQHIN